MVGIYDCEVFFQTLMIFATMYIKQAKKQKVQRGKSNNKKLNKPTITVIM